jgi:hypothetical protein
MPWDTIIPTAIFAGLAALWAVLILRGGGG